MDCHHFDRLLDALLDGACSVDEWRRAEEHLAGCARCRQLFDALGGHADTLDETGHASLTTAILDRTSGSPCLASRERLCDYVDGALAGLDRDLVGAHLVHCPACSALAGALVRSTAVLPSFAEIQPAASLADDVLAATSRRKVEPGIGERLAAWLARAAMRPRFSLNVAYAATLLILVLFGDPVQAVRRAVDDGAVYVQPGLIAVSEKVAAGLSGARSLGAEATRAVSSLAQRPDTASRGWDAGLSAVRQWLVANLGAPLASVLERLTQWIRGAMDAVIRLVRPQPPEHPPATEAARRNSGPTEPFRPWARLS
jgi:predicted anti-sigma-YlaC factor YlaD